MVSWLSFKGSEKFPILSWVFCWGAGGGGRGVIIAGLALAENFSFSFLGKFVWFSYFVKNVRKRV